VIEPYAKDYTTCTYSGGGLFQNVRSGEERRECVHYSAEQRSAAGLTLFDTNPVDWRINNGGMPDNSTSWNLYSHNSNMDARPRQCRPFPDFDPLLQMVEYDGDSTSAECPECFLPDGVTRVPPEYYNRATWTTTNYKKVMLQLQARCSRVSRTHCQRALASQLALGDSSHLTACALAERVWPRVHRPALLPLLQHHG